MKTWEMIKELTENPKKVFISHGSKKIDDMIAKINIVDCIKFDYLNSTYSVPSVDPYREWEEVTQPVTWSEAIEVIQHNHNKRLKVEHRPSGITTDFMFLHEILEYLSKFSNLATPDVILNGKWYIE